ncbi:MAG: hypothetical protein MJ252_03915 [archaeon]|nr:hypothetical protein [archaeon]
MATKTNMYIPLKFSKAKDIPPDMVSKFSNILQNYIQCLKKYERDLNALKFPNNPQLAGDFDEEYKDTIPEYIKKLPKNYFRGEVLKWFFSLPINKRQSVLAVENLFTIDILHQLYVHQKAKNTVRFFPRDFDGSVKSLEGIGKKENSRKIFTKNDTNTNLIAYYYLASEDYSLNKECNSMLEKSLFDEIIFYYPNIYSVGCCVLENRYFPFFTVTENFVKKETFIYFFEKLSRNKYLSVPCQINSHGTLNLPYWAYQPRDTNFCFSIDEIFISFLEQVLCVNFILYKKSCESIVEPKFDEYLILQQKLFEFAEKEKVIENILEYLRIEFAVKEVYYNHHIEKMVTDYQYNLKIEKDTMDSASLGLDIWKENIKYESVVTQIKEFFLKFVNSKELLSFLMFSRIHQIFKSEDFLCRTVFGILYENYSTKNAKTLLNFLEDEDFNKKKKSKNKKRNKKKKEKEGDNINTETENKKEEIENNIINNENKKETIKETKEEDLKENPMKESKDLNKIEEEEICTKTEKKEDKKKTGEYSFIISKKIINLPKKTDSQNNLIKQNNIKFIKKNFMGCSLYVNSQCSEPPIETMNETGILSKIEDKEDEKDLTSPPNELLCSTELHDNLIQKKTEKNMSETSSTVSEEMMKGCCHLKTTFGSQDTPHLLIENLQPKKDEKRMMNEIGFEEGEQIIDETENKMNESQSNEKKKKKKKKESSFFLFETQKKKKEKPGPNTSTPKYKSFIAKLNSDIIEYNKSIKKILECLRPIKEKIVEVIQEDILKLFNEKLSDLYQPNFKTYGSFTTGLDIESSDIDISLSFKPMSNYSPLPLNIYEYMDPCVEHFRSKPFYEFITPIYTASTPVIKLRINYDNFLIQNANKEGFNELQKKYEAFTQSEHFLKYEFDKNELSTIKVDISFLFSESKGKNGGTTKRQIGYVKNSLMKYPEISPIIKIIKRMLKLADHNNPYKGGIASYTLFLLSTAYCRHFREHYKEILQSTNFKMENTNTGKPNSKSKKNGKRKNKINNPPSETQSEADKNNIFQNNYLGNILVEMIHFYSAFEIEKMAIDCGKNNLFFKIEECGLTDLTPPVIIDPCTGQNAGHSSFKINEVLEFFKCIYLRLEQLQKEFLEELNSNSNISIINRTDSEKEKESPSEDSNTPSNKTKLMDKNIIRELLIEISNTRPGY